MVDACAIFTALLAIRWSLQLLLVGSPSFHGPKDVLTASLLLAYLVLGALSFAVGEFNWRNSGLLAIAVVVRTAALVKVRNRFSHSVMVENRTSVITGGIYGYHRNPLLLGLWLELSAFALTLPLPFAGYVFLILLVGFLCTWHAQEDNNRLTDAFRAYRTYFEHGPTNFPLNIVFPTRTRIIDATHFHIDTYGLYACVGIFFGEMVAIGFGVPVSLFFWVLPGVFAGALWYWQIASGTSVLRAGFFIFGGIAGGVVITCLYLWVHDSLSVESLSAMTLALVSGHAIGRIGCMAHGCCTGKPLPERQPYFFAYRDPASRVNRIRNVNSSWCFPAVQLEALAQVTLALVCFIRPQYALSIGLVGYGSLRVMTQTLRMESGDPTRVAVAGLMVLGGIVAAVFAGGTSDLDWTIPSTIDSTTALLLAIATACGSGVRLHPSDRGQSSPT